MPQLKEALAATPAKALAHDIWTDCNNSAYLMIHVRYATSDWSLRSHILRFINITVRHSGLFIVAMLQRVCVTYSVTCLSVFGPDTVTTTSCCWFGKGGCWGPLQAERPMSDFKHCAHDDSHLYGESWGLHVGSRALVRRPDHVVSWGRQWHAGMQAPEGTQQAAQAVET